MFRLKLALSVCAIIFPLLVSARDKDDGDDFSNNLFSDLAPILTLFGEQVAKQFMSQSMGWADNIIFAMAPLGIITAIVGAIRVGGPAWLRAIIGRARENRAAAEVELMSSTSPDVCELWNGQNIVRMMGSPPILQIICFHDPVPASNERFFTLEEANRKGLIKPDKNGTFLEIFEYFLKGEPPVNSREGTAEGEKGKGLKPDSNEPTGPPNILFNVRPAKSRLHLYCTAVIGVLLQCGVLVFSGFITYHPALAFRKGDRPVTGYAYPFTASGTLILVLGMLICSFVVEQHTKEVTWKSKGAAQFDLLWLQQGQEVNDQMFDSYAVLALGSRHSILTSRSHHRPERVSISHGTIKYRVAELLARICRSLLPFLSDRRNSQNSARSSAIFKALVISGAFISICGFVVQFIGLRAMHWSATIAQLAATLIMVVLRVWVRWDLASRPHSQKVAQGHELDWLATRIAREPKGPHDGDYKGLWAKPGPEDSFWTSECWRWAVVTGGDVKGYKIRDRQHENTEDRRILTEDGTNVTEEREDPAEDGGSLAGEREKLAENGENLTEDDGANNVVQARQRLGVLSHWPSKASGPAISVALAIEAVTNTLFTGIKDHKSDLTWSMDGRVDEKSQKTFFTLRRENNRWTADATEIEAALSLWLYSVAAKERIEVARSKDVSEELEKTSTLDWIRLGDAALRKENIRLLGANKPASCRDLTWYLGAKADMISVVQENASDGNGLADVVVIESHRVVGFKEKEATPSFNAMTRFKRRDLTVHDVGIGEDASPPATEEYLAVVSDTSLEMLLAQEMFSAFMWGISERAGPVVGDSKVHRNDTKIASDKNDWQNIRLENSELLKVAEAFQKAGLGTVEEAYSIMIPPLSLQGKLPVALSVVEYAKGIALEAEAVGHWEEAGDVYLWLFEVGKSFAASDRVAVMATAVLTEFCSLVDGMLEDSEGQRRSEEMEMLEDLQNGLSNALKTADNSVRDVLRLMYVIQHRDENGRHMNSAVNAQGIARALASLAGPVDSGLTDLHRAVFENSYLKVGRSLRKIDNPECKDILGWTALHYSILTDPVDTTTLLLKTSTSNSTSPNSRTLTGWTALHLAAYTGSLPAAWKLLDARCELETRGRDGMRPLHIAIRESNEEMVQWLLNAGADIDARDSARRTPLHWAAYSGNPNLVALLKEKGANRVSRDDNGRTPLHLAGFAENAAPLKDLAEAEILEAKDRMGWTLLHVGAYKGAEHFVANLLELEVDVNSVDRHDQTPLSWAAGEGHEAVVKLLLEKGADVESKDILGWTPLLCAAREGHEAVVKLLLDKGADMESKDEDGQTPLSWAAEKGHEAVVKLLLEKGADIKTKDKNGRTLLSWAAGNGHKAMVKLLLEKGADIKTKDGDGLTPLRWAECFGHEGIIKLLKSKGAE